MQTYREPVQIRIRSQRTLAGGIVKNQNDTKPLVDFFMSNCSEEGSFVELGGKLMTKTKESK